MTCVCSSIDIRRTTETRTTHQLQAPLLPTKNQRRMTSTINIQRTRNRCLCHSLCLQHEHKRLREMPHRHPLHPPLSSPLHPWYVSLDVPLTVIQQPPPPGAVETMPGDLAMGKSLAKGPSFDRLSIIPKEVPLAEAIKSPRKTHSSRFFPTERRELEKLPSLHGILIFRMPLTLDVPTSNRPELFIQKLEQCNVIFDFRDPSMDIRSKEIKRSTLQELLEYISSNRNVIQPTMYGKIVNMVSSNSGVADNSLQRISFVLYHPLQILSVMYLIRKKMSRSWKLRGLIYKLSMNSSSASSNPKTSMSLQQNLISIPSLCCSY